MPLRNRKLRCLHYIAHYNIYYQNLFCFEEEEKITAKSKKEAIKKAKRLSKEMQKYYFKEYNENYKILLDEVKSC